MGKCCAGIWLMVQNVLWSWMRTALGMGNRVEEDDKDLADNRSLIWAQNLLHWPHNPGNCTVCVVLSFLLIKWGQNIYIPWAWKTVMTISARLWNQVSGQPFERLTLWTVNFSSLTWRPRLGRGLSSWDSCAFPEASSVPTWGDTQLPKFYLQGIQCPLLVSLHTAYTWHSLTQIHILKKTLIKMKPQSFGLKRKI